MRRDEGIQRRPRRDQETRNALFFAFVCFNAGVGGNDGRSNDHSNKGQGNQEVVHLSYSMCGLFESAHISMIGGFAGNLNTTMSMLGDR